MVALIGKIATVAAIEISLPIDNAPDGVKPQATEIGRKSHAHMWMDKVMRPARKAGGRRAGHAGLQCD
jgi:hypothetical protein